MEPPSCAGSCPEHPACPGLVVRRSPRPAPGDRGNAQCGRCGALYAWDGRVLVYLDTHLGDGAGEASAPRYDPT
ncbi:MAG: hypothetical protein ACREQ5_23410 [Candidatus Dormibacteria bacterium]